MVPEYRVQVAIDQFYQHEECDGGPMPMTPERYAGNEYRRADGSDMPWEEYQAYYGNPDRHVVLDVWLEQRCACCSSWTAVEGASLSGIDFMDDSPEIARVTLPRDTLTVEEATGKADYLAEVVRELIAEATQTEAGKTTV